MNGAITVWQGQYQGDTIGVGARTVIEASRIVGVADKTFLKHFKPTTDINLAHIASKLTGVRLVLQSNQCWQIIAAAKK